MSKPITKIKAWAAVGLTRRNILGVALTKAELSDMLWDGWNITYKVVRATITLNKPKKK